MVVAVFSAWLVPGLGHVYLKRRLRGLAFFVLVMASLLVGCSLEGKLYQVGSQASRSAIWRRSASMGMGFPYFLLRYGARLPGRT